jgi:hypothetical protein
MLKADQSKGQLVKVVVGLLGEAETPRADRFFEIRGDTLMVGARPAVPVSAR